MFKLLDFISEGKLLKILDTDLVETVMNIEKICSGPDGKVLLELLGKRSILLLSIIFIY